MHLSLMPSKKIHPAFFGKQNVELPQEVSSGGVQGRKRSIREEASTQLRHALLGLSQPAGRITPSCDNTRDS